MVNMSVEGLYEKSKKDGIQQGEWYLGVQMTLQAIQMAADRGQALSVPVSIEGIRSMAEGEMFALSFRTIGGQTYELGVTDTHTPDAVFDKRSLSTGFADQVVSLRRALQNSAL